MKFCKQVQDSINQEVLTILTFLPYGIINRGFAQKVPEQRMSQEIETYTKNIIIETFNSKADKFLYLKKIEENNGSSKAPYELLFLFEIGGINYDVYVDFKPINTLKESTAPFMGSINKYIERMENQKFYDIFMIVKYESEVDKLPNLKQVELEFVKDITNYSLYNNWQLQLSINKTKVMYGRKPTFFQKDMIKLLEKMETETIEKIKSRCDKNIQRLKNIQL